MSFSWKKTFLFFQVWSGKQVFWFAKCTYGGLICRFWLSLEKFPIELLLSVVENMDGLLYKFALKNRYLLMDLWEEEFMHLFFPVFCLVAFCPNCSTSPRNVMSHQSPLTHQTVCCLSVRLRCLVCVQFSFHLSGAPFKVPVVINSQLVFVRTLFLLFCGQSMLKWKFESLWVVFI